MPAGSGRKAGGSRSCGYCGVRFAEGTTGHNAATCPDKLAGCPAGGKKSSNPSDGNILRFVSPVLPAIPLNEDGEYDGGAAQSGGGAALGQCALPFAESAERGAQGAAIAQRSAGGRAVAGGRSCQGAEERHGGEGARCAMGAPIERQSRDGGGTNEPGVGGAGRQRS